MANEGRWTLSRVYQRLFPERQIYVRTHGEVRFVTFTGPAQFVLASLAATVGLWLAFATFQFIFQNDIIAAKNDRIRSAEVAYESLQGELRDTQLRFISTARDLDAKHNQLLALVSQKDQLEQRLNEISARLAEVADDHLAASKEAASLRGELEGERSLLNDRIGTLQGELRTTLDQRSDLEQNLQETRSRVASLSAERDSLIKSNADLKGGLEAINRRLREIRDEQQRFVDRIAARTSDDITTLQDTIAMTGLDPNELYQQMSSETAIGGPVIDPDAADDGTMTALARLGIPEFDSAVAGLEDDLQRWEALQGVLKVLPLAAPADNFYISSEFGRRRDPFTKRMAFHAGIDLAGPPQQAVYATAPGAVVVAGRNGPFGNMVEIDHGFGLRTRYGHLNKILVKKGDSVDFRTAIGRMGSTGRSTGTHLHYEIRFGGKAYDPSRFLKAGKYVFKN